MQVPSNVHKLWTSDVITKRSKMIGTGEMAPPWDLPLSSNPKYWFLFPVFSFTLIDANGALGIENNYIHIIYVFIQTYKKPVTEYQIIREKAASQKRDVERALTRFMAKTGETEKLFEDDPYAYPCKNYYDRITQYYNKDLVWASPPGSS